MQGRLKGLAACAATLVAAVGVAACGSDDSGGGGSSGGGGGGKGAPIAFLLPENQTTRYERQDRPNFERKVKELCSDCEVIYANATQDAAKQQQQAESAITKGAKVIVMSSVDVKSAGAIVQKAKQSKIPVVAYGRLIPDAPIDYYVSIDPFKVGQQQAEVQMKEIKAKGGKSNPNVVMINGAPTDSNAKPYKDGARQVLEKEGAKIVKEFDTPDWTPSKAQTEMEQSITALGKDGFDAVYVANDGMAGGAIAALKSANIDPKTKFVTGQDAEVAGVQRILTGDQLMTVYQPIIQIAETAAEIAVPLAQGKKPDAKVTPEMVDNGAKKVPSALLATVAIQTNNIQDPLVKDGFLKPNELCTSAYKEACAKAGIK
jgi:D-xylose transport system substrate-binding protein